MLEKIIVFGYAVGVPTLMFLYIPILREWVGIWRSGGADVLGIFVALDATIAYDPASYAKLLRAPRLAPDLVSMAVPGMITSMVLIVVAVAYGEKKIAEAERLSTSHFPFWPFVIIWSTTVWTAAGHILLYLRRLDMSGFLIALALAAPAALLLVWLSCKALVQIDALIVSKHGIRAIGADDSGAQGR